MLSATAFTAHALFVPLYLQGVDGNILFMEPNYICFLITISWVILQLIVLKIQHHKPRFFLSKEMKEKLRGPDYYQYEYTFEEGAMEIELAAMQRGNEANLDESTRSFSMNVTEE